MGYTKKIRRRRSKATGVAEEMRFVLKKLSAHTPTIHPEIWARWSEIVGVELAKRTCPRALYGKQLLLAVTNSAWMNELSFLKRSMLERLAEEIGPSVVKDIRFVLDPNMRQGTTIVPSPPKKKSLQKPLPESISSAIEKVQDGNLREIITRAAKASIES